MKKVFILVLKSLFNPITLITIFAPILVLKINYFKLRDDLTNTFYSENFLELKELVTNNKWADALVDINIQYVVLLVAFIFAILESVVGIITILRNYDGHNSK